ncbi:hypothetical protein [Actinopolymorpha cephalotaxi]|uniref:Uncharacterized protein n=1 Tax=Actinopolymorpha cephalotaxi TaxID=504797 RepID=A0ABX2RWT1_9ACTN|nr:hypothetical protein [Actinopolymorpha cephalotaxi]NYH81831.1 hypothetical protein [Actinopolymorpha cephalotaxi]
MARYSSFENQSKGPDTTKLQEAAYNSQLAAGLPISELARTLFVQTDGAIPLRCCASYVHAIQNMDWFKAAFTAHGDPVVVVGGRGSSGADAAQRRVKIDTNDRWNPSRCEHACLHELARVVTPDRGSDGELREPAHGRDSSRGHHHAWRANFVFIVRMTLGKQAALRLRHEFCQWGLPTR